MQDFKLIIVLQGGFILVLFMQDEASTRTKDRKKIVRANDFANSGMHTLKILLIMLL